VAEQTPMTIRESFLFRHMVRALQSEPSWDVAMYCAYNDIDRLLEKELAAEYARYLKQTAGGIKGERRVGGDRIDASRSSVPVGTVKKK
jgi:hypothetical protein